MQPKDPSTQQTDLQIEVVQPTGLERRAAFMLLPEIQTHSYWNLFLLARDAHSKRILGAAAACPGRNENQQPRLHFRLHVPAPYRRRSVGRHLLDALTSYATERNHVELTARVASATDPQATPFLLACGFQCVDSFREYETTTEKLASFVLPLRDWLRERNEIPTSARIIPLAQAPLEPVAKLHCDELAGDYPAVLQNLQNICKNAASDDNAVLLLDDKVVGLLMGVTQNGITRIEASIVAPELRGSAAQPGWANLALMAERIEWALQRGSQRCRFGSLQAATPTQKLAKRTGAVLVTESDFFVRPLA